MRTLFLALAALPLPAAALAQDKPLARAEVTKRIADLQRIVTPNGVERLEQLQIGGIRQWVSIRGRDKRNPILLYVHGGPAYPAMPTAWHSTRALEEYFTVVHWDQRAAGKTFTTSDHAKVELTMTVQRYLDDTVELIGWLRREFGKEQVFLLGHSWGSYLGVQVAQTHPQWLHAYIGVGQASDMPEGERRAWRFALDGARKAGNAEAVKELEAITGYAAPGKPIAFHDVMTVRKWLGRYGGEMYGRPGNSDETRAVWLSPDYTDDDLKRMWDANASAVEKLLPPLLSADLTTIRNFDTPVLMFLGRMDYNVSATRAAEWFATIRAPQKHLVWFEHSAHLVPNEEPGKFLVELVEKARPIAAKTGDVAPDP